MGGEYNGRTTSMTVSVTQAVDAMSGLNDLPNSIRYSTETLFTAAVTTTSGWFSGLSTQTWPTMLPNTSYYFRAGAGRRELHAIVGDEHFFLDGRRSVSTFTRSSRRRFRLRRLLPRGCGWCRRRSLDAGNNPGGTFYQAQASTGSDFGVQCA